MQHLDEDQIKQALSGKDGATQELYAKVAKTYIQHILRALERVESSAVNSVQSDEPLSLDLLDMSWSTEERATFAHAARLMPGLASPTGLETVWACIEPDEIENELWTQAELLQTGPTNPQNGHANSFFMHHGRLFMQLRCNYLLPQAFPSVRGASLKDGMSPADDPDALFHKMAHWNPLQVETWSKTIDLALRRRVRSAGYVWVKHMLIALGEMNRHQVQVLTGLQVPEVQVLNDILMYASQPDEATATFLKLFQAEKQRAVDLHAQHPNDPKYYLPTELNVGSWADTEVQMLWDLLAEMRGSAYLLRGGQTRPNTDNCTLY